MSSNAMKASGWLVALLGIVLLLVGFGKDTTAAFSDTLNIGLLNDKSNMIGVACTTLICGVLLVVGGTVAGAVERNSTDVPRVSPVWNATDTAPHVVAGRSPEEHVGATANVSRLSADEPFDPAAFAGRKDI